MTIIAIKVHIFVLVKNIFVDGFLAGSHQVKFNVMSVPQNIISHIKIFNYSNVRKTSINTTKTDHKIL